MNLPEEFEVKMKNVLGTEYDDFLYSYNNNRYYALRINSLKVLAEDENKILNKLNILENAKVDWSDNAYYYDEDNKPGKHVFHEMGLYYIQEPSAMSAAAMLNPSPGMRVLDLCAAPGGKSTQLASMLKGKGLLISNEINTQRAKILSSNIERMGVRNAVVVNEDSFRLADKFPGFFHAIQVDAPCSGEGMFRKLPKAMEEWSPNNVLLCAKRQLEILENAAVMLQPGGTIVYSTCTFSKEENEDVVIEFLKRHEDFYLDKQERFWPHKVKGEGHYCARLVLKGELKIDSYKSKVNKIPKERMKPLEEFLNSTLSKEKCEWILNGNLSLFGEQLYRLPDEDVDIKGIKVLRAGLHIGEYKKNRFEPSHSLALTLTKEDVKRSYDIDTKERYAVSFFEGESIPAQAESGWTLVFIDGYSAGWTKASNNMLKNHYPKGLRKSCII